MLCFCAQGQEPNLAKGQGNDGLAGTNFWKGSRYFCEAEATALEGEEEQLARTTISAYAEAMDAAEKLEDISVAGEHLQPQFEKVRRDTSLSKQSPLKPSI